MRKFSILLLLVGLSAHAQIPTGYYSSATGTGYTLKTQLHNIIDNHNNQGYGGLWNFYFNYGLDNYYENDGTILDIYSENPSGADPYNYTKGSDQCGSSGSNVEGDCYNREHTFPRSWFGGDNEPMNSDVHHVFASDKRVNSERGSNPYGEVGSTSWTSQNGSKSGSARSGLGYSGAVFEPIDEFKGDVARAHFYMATRYEDLISGWQNLGSANNVLDGSSDQVFDQWVIDMLIQWHNDDPVSQYEIDRNDNAYYNHQGNRNPFIDHPEWVACIWEGNCSGGSDPNLSTTAPNGGFDFGEVPSGQTSVTESYQVNGSNLEGDVTVSVASPFELSLNNSTWSSSVTVGQSSAEGGSGNTVFVRFSPTVENGNTYNQNISHSSANATTLNVAVTGTEKTTSINTVREAINGSNGQEFTVEGVVTTPDYGGSHGQYFLQDDTGGINIFHLNNKGLVNRGDLVQITGTRTVFSGIIELEPSSVSVLSTNQDLPNPITIGESDLSTGSINEGSLVRISGVTLDNASEWPTSTGGSGANVNATVGTTGFIIRIDDASFYFGSSAPTGELVVTGVLSQFNGDLQIFPFVDGDVQESSTLNPDITVAPSSLDFGDVVDGELSEILTLTLNASDLLEDISVTTGADFEFSELESGTYVQNLTISAGSGDITNQTIYVRFSPDQLGSQAAAISFQSGSEAATSNLSGNGIAPSPAIEISVTGFESDFRNIRLGEVSPARSYTVSGEHLTEHITVSAPDHFEISLLEASGFGQTLSLTQANGTVNNITIYARFSPTTAGNLSGNITHASSGESESVSVEGVGEVVADADELPSVKIYPNPVNGVLKIENFPAGYTVRIFDGIGRRMPVRKIGDGIDVSDFENGQYFLTIATDTPIVFKFLVR